MPFKFVAPGIFPNDVSDHCVIAVVRDTRIPKSKPCFVEKRNMKLFDEQAILHDLYNFNWDRIALFDDVELAWNYFHKSLICLVNKHAPFHKFRIKGRDNPWFTTDLADVLHERNAAWARARESGLEADWLNFRQLRNKFTFFSFEKQMQKFTCPRLRCVTKTQRNSGRPSNHCLLAVIQLIFHPVYLLMVSG